MVLDNRGNWTLIGLLAAAAVAAVLVYVLTTGGSVTTVKSDSELLDKASKKHTVLGKSIDTAKAAECRNQLDQIRKGIITYKAASGAEENPLTLKDIGLGVSNTFFQCPVSEAPYTYDAATGKVACPTHPDF